MRTIYLYVGKEEIKNNQSHYTVIKSQGDNKTIAVEKAEQYARLRGLEVPGGFFVAHAKPYNFLTNYKVIELPKNYKLRKRKVDLTDKLMSYEMGELTDNETLELFSELVKKNLAFKLQGHYGRTAMNLIKMGYLDKDGNILKR